MELRYYNGSIVSIKQIEHEAAGPDKTGYNRAWPIGSWVIMNRDNTRGFYVDEKWISKNTKILTDVEFTDLNTNIKLIENEQEPVEAEEN